MSPAPRPVINATAVEVAADAGTPPGFLTRYRSLGPLLGGELLGATVYEFDPGERNGPYHYEIGNEECLLVLAGTPTLRHPEGRDVLAVGDMVVFPDGADGAHQLINESDARHTRTDAVDHAGAIRVRVSRQRQAVNPRRHLQDRRDGRLLGRGVGRLNPRPGATEARRRTTAASAAPGRGTRAFLRRRRVEPS